MSAQAFRRLTSCSLTFHNPRSQLYHPNNSWGLEGPSNHSTAQEVGITSLLKNRGDAKSDASLPPVLAGMDKAEALANVSRLFDAAQAGAVLWGDKLLLKRYLAQYSRTGPAEQTGELTFQAIKM